MSVRAAAAFLGVSALLGPGTVTAGPGRDGTQGAPLVIAHRGASAYAPENTLAAVDAARELGCAWVENDVRRTRDGELVVVHDETLARTTDVEQRYPGRAPWRVRDFTAAEIATLDAGSWFGERWAGERVPTLREYLDRLDAHGQRLLLEVKNPELYPGIEADILRVLGREGWLERRHVRYGLVVQSFGAAALKAVRAQRPDVVTGFLGTPAVADLPAYAAFTDQIHPSRTTVTADYVAAVHALKGAHGVPLRVSAWTVNDAADARRVAGLGVDGIITDRPDVIAAAVARD
ncbi:glycerophosphodiester phosphodiesterase family protein [Streptomyces sp. HUAS MG47]|uniref:glycerophosphodiester phosphodiesterase n=1 Tax=Streptomyces solicamelliae TaxID=3231716 RepID=UPI0038779F4C